MNAYEEKQERRRERLEARAERLRKAGEGRINQARTMASAIPFGQPILVGHHSECRDRRYRAKIHNNFAKGFETLEVAAEVAGRAASVGTGGISSDDPDAVQKLQAQLAEEENIHNARVADNKAARKDGKVGPWEGWELSNRSANIRRIKQRIAHLARNATRETTQREVDGVRIVQNAEINRLQLIFPGKPSADIRTLLKRNGFRWSPTEGAWQKHLNGWSDSAATYIMAEIAKLMPNAT